MEDYQERVVNEKLELDRKIDSLNEFLMSEKSQGISSQERERMQRQFGHMTLYSGVLQERIENF